jgi:two-component system, NtrC family, nitrogen regulation sensor histidine kinase NtrY
MVESSIPINMSSAANHTLDDSRATLGRSNAGDDIGLGKTTLVDGAGKVPAYQVFTYCIALVLTFVALLFTVSGGDIVGPASIWIIVPLLISSVIIGYLFLTVWSRIALLRRAGREAQTGARLHLRFVSLFAAASVLPAIVVALFSGLTIQRGVQAWFSSQVRDAVEATRRFGNDSIDRAAEMIKVDLAAMAVDLNASAIQLRADPKAFQAYLAGQADRRGFVAVYVLDDKGKKLVMAQRPAGVPPFVAPDSGDFANAQAGDVDVNQDSKAIIRALYRLDGFSNSYLAAVRLPEPGQLELFEKAGGAVRAYKLIEDRQGRLQFLFALAYLELIFLVMIGSAWLGLISAGRISVPIGLLAQAAERVRGGDLNARVDNIGQDDEIAALGATFNRMTGELQFQRVTIEQAREQAESRSAFIRAVLEGVSAGVVSLDASKTVRAANGSAVRLLQLDSGDLEGLDFTQVAPEFASIVSRVRPGFPAQGQAERVIGTETLLFDVRAAFAGDDLVVTFDDVSGLLAAQRQAAWKDVARRIAHEIKNPLTPIQLSAERLKRKYANAIPEDRETFVRLTDTIVRQVSDIGRMVDEFSSFARMPAPRFADDDVCEALRQAVFAQRVASPDIEVSSNLPPEQVLVSMDVRLITQAFANLLKNAAEGISTRRSRDNKDFGGEITATLSVDDTKAWIEIVDNGVGFPVQDRRRLLEPYMTTRAKGTGLGLAIVSRALEDHGGSLELCDRADGKEGARVRLNLPLVKADAARGADPTTKNSLLETSNGS